MGNQWQSRSKMHTSIPAAPVSKGVSWRRPFPEQNTQVQPKSDDKADGQAYQRRPPSNAMSRLDSSLDLPRAMKPIQTKLTVGAPGDQYEQEADRVADQVMSMPDAATQAPVQREGMPEEDELQTKPLAAAITPLVQRESMPEEEEVQTKAIGTLQREEMPEEEELQMKPIGMLQREEAMPEEEEVQAKPLGGSIQREAMPEEEELQAKPLGNGTLQREAMPEEEEAVQAKGAPDAALPAGSNLESRLSSSQGGGSPLSNDVRSFMEPRFGADFSQVRVHTGSEAVQMNRDLNAQAFTYKGDVYFGAGKAPAKDVLTAHELTHVVQQPGHPQAKVNPGSPGTQNLSKVASSSETIQMKRRPGEVPEGQARIDAADENLQNRLLFDFDVDDATLKPVHTASLDEMLRFISADFEKRKESTEPLWLIGVDGFATHTGTAEHNQALSQAREENTFIYIDQHLFDNIRAVDADSFESRIHRDPKFHGFNKTTVQGENPLGRSVQVLMKRPNLSSPPTAVPPSKPTSSSNFQIRCLKFTSTTFPTPIAGLQGETDFASYEIVDQHNRSAVFSYVGNGVAVALPKISLPQIDNFGVPQTFVSFKTTKPVRLEDFAGHAQIVQPPSIGPKNLGDPEIAFEAPRFGLGKVQTIPRHLEVPIGTTSLLTILTSTEGELSLQSAGTAQSK